MGDCKEVSGDTKVKGQYGKRKTRSKPSTLGLQPFTNRGKKGGVGTKLLKIRGCRDATKREVTLKK